MSRGKAYLGIIVVAVVATGLAAYALRGADAATSVFTVHMATPGAGGSDANSGLSASQPVATLHRVHEVLKANRPTTDVEVRIRQGAYVVPPMGNWYFYVPGHTISFLPADYQYGDSHDDIAGRPVFRNKRQADGTYPAGNHERECAAYHNRFVYNRVLSAYNGSRSLPVWSLDPAGNAHSGGSPCTLPSGEQRVYTGGNTRS